jgi:hypothetical protein
MAPGQLLFSGGATCSTKDGSSLFKKETLPLPPSRQEGNWALLGEASLHTPFSELLS